MVIFSWLQENPTQLKIKKIKKSYTTFKKKNENPTQLGKQIKHLKKLPNKIPFARTFLQCTCKGRKTTN